MGRGAERACGRPWTAGQPARPGEAAEASGAGRAGAMARRREMSDRPVGERITRRSGRGSARPLSARYLRAWAAEVAATLPPLTEPQVAAVARLATHLDANDSQEVVA
jgi:hypothetical protein